MPDKGYILLITVAADCSLQRTMKSTTPEKKTDSRYWTHSEHVIEVQHEMQIIKTIKEDFLPNIMHILLMDKKNAKVLVTSLLSVV